MVTHKAASNAFWKKPNSPVSFRTSLKCSILTGSVMKCKQVDKKMMLANSSFTKYNEREKTLLDETDKAQEKDKSHAPKT